MLEADWKTFESDTIGRLKTAITEMLVTVGLGGGMWGEEIVWIDIGVIRKHWQEALKHPEEPHIPLAMAGRFERTVGEKVYIQPLALESASGLQYRCTERMGRQQGWLGVQCFAWGIREKEARRKDERVSR
jgi:hypothetical protein